MKSYETPEYKISVEPAPDTAKEMECESIEQAFVRIACGLGMLFLMVVFLGVGILFASLLGGCAAESAKIVEGTDLSVGFSLPGAEGEANFTLFNWLSGFKTTTAESSRVKLRYRCAETNDYFGCIHTRTQKTVDATITPVIEEADEEEAESGETESGETADAPAKEG